MLNDEIRSGTGIKKMFVAWHGFTAIIFYRLSISDKKFF